MYQKTKDQIIDSVTFHILNCDNEDCDICHFFMNIETKSENSPFVSLYSEIIQEKYSPDPDVKMPTPPAWLKGMNDF